MNSLTPEDRQTLVKAETLLSRETRHCGVQHEGYKRDERGMVLLPSKLIDECPDDVKHFACPHLWDKLNVPNKHIICNALDILQSIDDDEKIPHFIGRFLDILDIQNKLDMAVSLTRTNIDNSLEGTNDYKPIKLLTFEEAQRKSTPDVVAFHKNCDSFETFRLGMLAKVREALGLEAASQKL